MNTSVTDTDLLGDLLFGPAQSLGGSKLGDDELIKLAADNFTEKPFCIVRRWLLLDVMLPAIQERQLKAKGLEATVLYAQAAVFDSQSKHQPGDSIVTGHLRDFDGCIFETDDKVFILPAVARESTSVRLLLKRYVLLKMLTLMNEWREQLHGNSPGLPVYACGRLEKTLCSGNALLALGLNRDAGRETTPHCPVVPTSPRKLCALI